MLFYKHTISYDLRCLDGLGSTMSNVCRTLWRKMNRSDISFNPVPSAVLEDLLSMYSLTSSETISQKPNPVLPLLFMFAEKLLCSCLMFFTGTARLFLDNEDRPKHPATGTVHLVH